MNKSSHFVLHVPHDLWTAMIAHAQAELPIECCGLLTGTIADGIGHVRERFSLVNSLASPTEFESDAPSMLKAHKAMRTSGTEILAIYHSHPTSDPIPSRRDIERNYDENVVNIIIGLRGEKPDVRAWWISADGCREAEVVVHHFQPDQFFNAEQRDRLASLMTAWRQARDSGKRLSEAEQSELDALIDAELEAARLRAEAMLRDVEAIKTRIPVNPSSAAFPDRR